MVSLAALALLVAYACPARAGEARAVFTVSANVVQSISVRLVDQPRAFTVTQEDVRKGYVDVADALRLEVSSPAGAALVLRVSSSVVSTVTVRGLDSSETVIANGATGQRLVRPAPAAHVRLDCVFRLHPQAMPGRYAWPLGITILPL